ncbi:MAG TPA: hypothetical protein VHE37_15185, partial [Nevskiaceae bacterium]|nr:hypothetical protein [Nevskiaceae bacterium]
ERTPAQAANDAADANAGTQILVPSPIGQGFSVLQASVVAQSDSGKLLRFKDGTLKYIGNLAMLATPSPAVSAAANSDPAAVAAPPLAEPVH